MHHRPSGCVCLGTRMDFREYSACSNQNSCFSWTGLCLWMCVHPLWCHDVQACLLSRVQCDRGNVEKECFYKSQVHDNQNGSCVTPLLCGSRPHETFNQQIICAINFTLLSCLLSLHCNVIGRVKQRAGDTGTQEGNEPKSHVYDNQNEHGPYTTK